jgi:hypothetical protein
MEDWRGMIVVCASQRKAKFTLSPVAFAAAI